MIFKGVLIVFFLASIEAKTMNITTYINEARALLEPAKLRQLSTISSILSELQNSLDVSLPFVNVPFSTYITKMWEATNTGLSTSYIMTFNVVYIIVFTALSTILWFFQPNIFNNLNTWYNTTTYRSLADGLGNLSVDDLFNKFNRAMNRFEIDSDACMKMAYCTLGKTQFNNRMAKSNSFTPVDLLNGIINLPIFNNSFFGKKGYRSARDYGESGGDCGQFNREKKCPLDDETWKLLLNSINSAI